MSKLVEINLRSDPQPQVSRDLYKHVVRIAEVRWSKLVEIKFRSDPQVSRDLYKNVRWIAEVKFCWSDTTWVLVSL